jgi:hypothetical protein
MVHRQRRPVMQSVRPSRSYREMITMIRSALVGQYGAALSMLRGCVENVDSAIWLGAVGKFPFWHVAYHTLYYTDLYLSQDEEAFRPQTFHRDGYNFLGPQPWAPGMRVVADLPFDKAMLITYLDAARVKAKSTVDGETETTLAGPSGFTWLGFTRLESHLYNLRHIQHHCGQLAAVLRSQGDKGVDWVSSESR